MRTWIGISLSAALALGAARPALALTGDELLAKMDEAMTRAEDHVFEYEVINEEKGHEPRVMAMRVHVKGEMRLTEFSAPGDMKGTKALVRSRTQMWIYLPAYNKVRRVASSTSSGSFMGTTFSNDDVSTSTYHEIYDGELVSETDTEWIVRATRKEGADTAYGQLEFTIGKELVLPAVIKYFNDKGAHTKTETRTGYSCSGDVCNAESMKMVDHTRNDASTEILRRGWEVNTGIGDDVFSVRNLQ